MRLAHRTLGRSKPKDSWQYFTVLMLLVLNSFIKNVLMTKSKACRLDLVKGQNFVDDVGLCMFYEAQFTRILNRLSFTYVNRTSQKL